MVSIAKRHVGPTNNFFELVSDGNMSLIRAVEKFDFSRGNKFSTYASWAIMKNFARTIPEENYRRDRFVTGHEEMFEAAADNRTDEHEYESALKRMQEAVKGMLGRLDERERKIIISRFGLGGVSEQTLEQLGRELGITKERVRQIESRAQQKLRNDRQRGKARPADALRALSLCTAQPTSDPGSSSAVMARGASGVAFLATAFRTAFRRDGRDCDPRQLACLFRDL